MNRNDRAIVGLVAIAHAMVHTYELSIPVLVPIWLATLEGATPATMGLVTAAGYALFGVGALPGGLLADAYGSRRVIIASLLGMSGAFLVLAAAPSLAAVAVALVLWGAAASVYHPAGLSLISTGVDERGSAFAYHGIAGNLGIAGGPLAAALLLLVADWRAVAAALAVPAAAAALVGTRLHFDEAAAVAETDGGPEAAGRGGSVTSLSEFRVTTRTLFASAFALVFGMVVFSGLYYRGVLTFLPDLLADLPGMEPVRVGERTIEPSRYAYAALLTVGVAGQYAGGKLSDRIQTTLGLAGGYVGLAVLALLFLPAAALGPVPFALAAAALGVVLFLIQPLMQATVADYTPAGTRGLSYGYTYLGVFGVGALGAAVAGATLDYASPAALFGLLAAFAAVAAAVAAVLTVRSRR